jgi:hypothetical protein
MDCIRRTKSFANTLSKILDLTNIVFLRLHTIKHETVVLQVVQGLPVSTLCKVDTVGTVEISFRRTFQTIHFT